MHGNKIFPVCPNRDLTANVFLFLFCFVLFCFVLFLNQPENPSGIFSTGPWSLLSALHESKKRTGFLGRECGECVVNIRNRIKKTSNLV